MANIGTLTHKSDRSLQNMGDLIQLPHHNLATFDEFFQMHQQTRNISISMRICVRSFSQSTVKYVYIKKGSHTQKKWRDGEEEARGRTVICTYKYRRIESWCKHQVTVEKKLGACASSWCAAPLSASCPTLSCSARASPAAYVVECESQRPAPEFSPLEDMLPKRDQDDVTCFCKRKKSTCT